MITQTEQSYNITEPQINETRPKETQRFLESPKAIYSNWLVLRQRIYGTALIQYLTAVCFL